MRIAAALAALVLLALPSAGRAGATTTLVPMGGGYGQTGLEAFAQTAIAHATPPTVEILVVPSAYDGNNPETGDNDKLASQRAQEIQDACNAVVNTSTFPGGCQATLLQLFTHSDAMNSANSAAFNNPAAAFILGGDQDFAMEVLANTPAESAMASAYQRGVVFGGTSAGAAILSHTMIAGFSSTGAPQNELQQGSIIMWWSTNSAQRGLSFGSNSTIFDQHFDQRGRFGRLLNAVAQSADQFGGSGLLGLGSDYNTTAVVSNDATISSVAGDDAAVILDLSAGSHQWVNGTLSARNVLTHLLAPGDGVSYDITHRQVQRGNQPIQFHAPAPWSLTPPGSGTLILGGDVSTDWTGPALAAFVSRAQATGSNRIVVVTAAYGGSGAQSAANAYASGLAEAGWSGTVQTVAHGTPSWDGNTQELNGAAGVLFVGGDQQYLSGPLADPSFTAYLRYAIAHDPVVMADHAMTSALGPWYVATPDPTSKNIENAAIADFQSGGVQLAPGLGILPIDLEPRLTVDYRWGRLYALVAAHPAILALGICDATAIVLDNTGAHLAGDLSAVSLDGQTASFATGSNGAISADNVVLDAFAPGDSVSG